MPSPVHTERIAISVRETSHALSVSTKTVRRMLADGRLRELRVGRRVLVLSESIARLVSRA
jgi:excisionase family DNA binding protein